MKNININLGKLFLVLISLPITAAIFATFTEIDLMKYFGWFGDEVGFVYVMVLFIYIAGYLAWNVNNKVIESEKPNRKSGNLVFLVTLGVSYSLVCIALPVWITQGPFQLDDFEQFFVLILLVFVVLCISIYISFVVVPGKNDRICLNLMMCFLPKYTNYYVQQNRHHRGPTNFLDSVQRI